MKIANYQIENYLQKIDKEKIAGCLLYGPNLVLSSYRLEMISKKIVSNLADPFLVSILSEARCSDDQGSIADEFYSIPMFGGRKLIIIKDAGNNTAQSIKQLISNKDFIKKSDNFILIQAGDLSKTSALRKIFEDSPSLVGIGCYEDDDQFIRKFVNDKLLENNFKFNANIVNLLIEKFGKNRQILSLEIEKLSQYFQENKNLTQETLNEILVEQNEVSLNQFINNFADKKFSLALHEAKRLLDEEIKSIGLIRIWREYFYKLYNCKLMIQRDKIDFDSAVKSQFLFFKIEADFRRHLKNISLQYLIKLLIDLEKIEIRIMSGEKLPKLIILDYILANEMKF